MLILKEKKEVVAYFEMLNSLKSNPYYKIDKLLNIEGNEVLTVEFALSDESFYGMLSLTAIFYKFGDKYLCVRQSIFGRSEHSDMVINYFKKTFKKNENGILENGEIINNWRQKKVFSSINVENNGKNYSLEFWLENDK